MNDRAPGPDVDEFPERMTHSEIAGVLGISRQRVAQIEAAAIEKMRRTMGSNYHGTYDIRDSIGVPEPRDDGQRIRTQLRVVRNQRRRADGRFG